VPALHGSDHLDWRLSRFHPWLQQRSAERHLGWNLEGQQVQLFNDTGATVARLYASSKTQFNGQDGGRGTRIGLALIGNARPPSGALRGNRAVRRA
jgi:hypothetical protein